MGGGNEGDNSKINKIKNCFFVKISKIDKPLADSPRKEKRIFKSIKLEMEKEKLQQTAQKYKGSEETTRSNYRSIKWIACKKWAHSQKSTTFQD